MDTPTHVKQAILPLILTVATAAGVVTLADSAQEHDGMSARIDPQLATDALNARTGIWTQLAHLLTFLGSEVVVGGLAMVLVIVLLKRRGPFVAGCAAAGMGLSIALTVILKSVVQRARPGGLYRLGPVDSTYSFPSGHSLNSAVLLGLFVILLVPIIRARSVRIAVGGGALLLAAGIGLSRVYLGYHWASDVLASWLIATALLTIVALAARIGRPAGVRHQSGDSQVDAPSVAS
ncbi:phosphatase PAP2 family protein [Aeromicrobium sp.]|uniref:phosphatase PAP2 family protein n=1 Tax=Aeromicrobium sp. TaxID=1871063 RepID=UPI003C550D97